MTPRAVAQRLLEIFPTLEPSERPLSLAIYRTLARGAPVAPRTLAGELGMPVEAVEHRLRHWPGVYYDAERRIVGYWGLSLLRMRHRLLIGGRELFAWCAWDTLFLPALLEARAEVDSACEASGAQVRLIVSPAAIESAEPRGLQVSFVLPAAEALRADVITSFCHLVHFFRSPGEAQPWLASHPGALLLPLEDAFEVGRIRNRARYGVAPELAA